jgi:cytochrome b561
MHQSAVGSRNEGDAGPAERYTPMAIILHWALAVLLLGQIAVGWFLETIPRGTAARGFYVNLHKSTGLTLALLIVVRIVWRSANRPPQLPAFLSSWQRHAAQSSHLALYACMLGMPLSGYFASNFSKHGVKFFNRIMLPPWGIDDPRLYALFNTTHVVLSYLFVTLICVHIFAAVRHVILRDGIFARMLP